jgi:hypothetical protein
MLLMPKAIADLCTDYLLDLSANFVNTPSQPLLTHINSMLSTINAPQLADRDRVYITNHEPHDRPALMRLSQSGASAVPQLRARKGDIQPGTQHATWLTPISGSLFEGITLSPPLHGRPCLETVLQDVTSLLSIGTCLFRQ